MAELKIDREDVNDRKKWRNNVKKRKSIGKQDYKSIIYNKLLLSRVLLRILD